MANPQIENGHVDIANDLAEAFFKIRISGCEWQLLWVILRKTYGWHKKQDFIALSQFSEMTGIPKPDIIRNLKKLLGKKIITIGNNPNAEGKTYGINKDFDKWNPLGKKITLGIIPINVGNIPNKSLGKKIPTKENYTKEKKEKKPLPLSPDFISPETWNDFLDHRKSKRSPLTPKACELIFGKLKKWKEKGHDPDAVLNKSIENGWTGIFEPEKSKEKSPLGSYFDD